MANGFEFRMCATWFVCLVLYFLLSGRQSFHCLSMGQRGVCGEAYAENGISVDAGFFYPWNMYDKSSSPLADDPVADI